MRILTLNDMALSASTTEALQSLLFLKPVQISVLQSLALQGRFPSSQDDISKTSPLSETLSQGSALLISLLKAQFNTK